MSETKEKRKRKLSRRDFLIVASVAGGGLLLGVKIGVPFARIKIAEVFDAAGGAPGSMDAEATAWFRIDPDNRVTLYIPKIEMGQGVHTALAQIAAEELEIEWQQLTVMQAATGQGLDDNFGTGSSNSVSSLYQPLREAAATMRVMLQTEAARQGNVPTNEITAQDGEFIHSGNGTSITYGEVVQNAGDWEIPENPPSLKAVQDFRFIGQSIDRVDLSEKIQAKAIFGYDVRLPNMLYGAVARPREIGATFKSAGEGEANSRPGVVKVVIKDGFAGVVAETREQAYSGLNAMSIRWDIDHIWQQAEIDALVTVGQGKGVVIQKEGNPDSVLEGGALMEAEYRSPMAFHAHLEPQAATADVQPEGVQVWASTQFPVRIREYVAKAIDRDETDVTVIPTYVGGGFGRKIGTEAAVEAAILSAAVGRPVQVSWTRAEDFRNGFLRPPTHHRFRGVLDGQKISAMEHQQASGAVAFPFLSGAFKAILGADFGSWRGAMIPYDIPNKGTTAWLSELPVPTGWWRGLGLMANTFAVESFLDEIAHAAETDPLAFRLAHLPEDEMGQRRRKVLETVAEKSGWGNTLPADRALGIASSADVGTVVAQVAEVSVEDGNIQVHKVFTVVDPGMLINPDGATAQIQGAIIMGLSSTLIEEVGIEDNELTAENFNRYPILTIKQAPEIETTLLESSQTPHGMGEPPIGPIAAAVANAVYTLTGQRLRNLPLKLN